MNYIIEQAATKLLPDMKPITFGVNPQPSTKQEFDQLLTQAFSTGTIFQQHQWTKQAWQYLKTGKLLTIADKIIYLKTTSNNH